jgi:hypothetical protein
LISRPQIFLLPINPPQYSGWTFQKEYGQSASWIAELIRAHPDTIKPIITGQPFDYKPYYDYIEIFEASRQTYSGDLPPCSQWRVESLIAKYRMEVDDAFKDVYSSEYFKLAKNHWASRVLYAFGFNRNIKPDSIEGRHLRHFLAVAYSIASFGLPEIVEHVIDASSRISEENPTMKMESAWRALAPYNDYLISPLRSDLSGISLKRINQRDDARNLQR